MASPYWVVQYLPAGLFETIGVIHPFAFLAGPLAILILAGWRRPKAGGREMMLPAALCLGLLSVTVPMVTGTMLLVQVLHRITTTGAGGSRMVANTLISASHPIFYGLLTVALCGAVLAWLALRSGAALPTSRRIRWGTAAAGVAAALGLLGLDVLLRQHHALTDTLITLIDPSRQNDPITAAPVLDRANGLLLYGGALLTFILLAAAGAIASRKNVSGPASTPVVPRFGRTFAAAAIVFALVGSLWHATQLWSSLEDYRAIARQGTSANSDTAPARDALALRR